MPQSTIDSRLRPKYGPLRQLQFAAKTKLTDGIPVGGMSLIATTALVLIASTDGFPRQPDTTQALHAFRQTAPVVVQPSQPVLSWPVNAPQAEPQFEIRRTNHNALHLYRQPFQTVGQPWQMMFPPPTPRLEPEPYRITPTDYSILYGRTTPAAASGDGTTWVSVKKLVFVSLEPERQPDRTQELHRFRTTFQTVGQPWQMFYQATRVRLEPESYTVTPVNQTPLYGRTTPAQPATDQPLTMLYRPNAVTLGIEEAEYRATNYFPLYGRTTPAGGSTPRFQWQPSNRVLEGEWDIRRADHSILHRYRQSFQTVGQPFYIFNWRTDVRLEPEWCVGRSDHGLLHRFRTVYQTVGQPWRALFPQTQVRLEAESYTVKSQPPLLHLYRTTFQTVGQPWSALFPRFVPTLEPEPYTQHPTDYTVLFGRPSIIVNQPWNAYVWQTPPPNTEADQHYDYRSRDFWSDLFPFLITPTTPVIPPVEPERPLADWGPMSASVGHHIEKRKKKRPEIEPIAPEIQILPEPIPQKVTLAESVDAATAEKLAQLMVQLRDTQGLILRADEELDQEETEEAIALLLLMLM